MTAERIDEPHAPVYPHDFAVTDHRSEFRAIVFRVARRKKLALDQQLAKAETNEDKHAACADYAEAAETLLAILSEMEGASE